jgi:ABC-type antimicrobial peptide transport system permease subunit
VRQIVADGRREFLVDVEPLEKLLARAPSSERMSATLAITVAVLAVILSFTGVSALLAYSVTRRTREIGVRSAPNRQR